MCTVGDVETSLSGQKAPLQEHERVAEEIRVHMLRGRLTQSALARKLGWPQQRLSRRLTGAVPFDICELFEIADALGTHAGVFFLAPDGSYLYSSAPGLLPAASPLQSSAA
jgi:transcriptional regulator with XRE-family HTH domain